jgi:site-specific recombinase XerD
MGLRGGPLFYTLGGSQMRAQYVSNLLKRLAEEAKIDRRVHPHGFRPTFAVELCSSGTDIVAAFKLLGHSSIAVTARYLITSPTMRQGRLLPQPSSPRSTSDERRHQP